MLTRLASKVTRTTRNIGRMSVNLDDFTVVKEGKATILAPKEDKVFYNHIQQFNRDLSVMAIKAWSNKYKVSREGEKELRAKRRKLNHTEGNSENGVSGSANGEISTPSVPQENSTPKETDVTKSNDCEKSQLSDQSSHKEVAESSAKTHAEVPYIRILEGLSATGLRAVRYGHEIPNVARVVANDLLPEAVRSINRSSEYNGLQEKVVGHQGDAIKYMGSLPGAEKFHVVDLDPYGTAAPFIDSAVQSVRDNGLLLVTCTDAGVLAGNGYPEKCFALYGGNNLGNTPWAWS
ncbi:hypothetical protein JCM33374_g399 [Metschnikowia sp. JCM 33374]|nr:hypothetical protein JCM33374_g399 [Metschnikowia sp. JCM 33374]